jgi:abequosyltransferase
MNMTKEKPLISVCIPAFNRPEFMSDLLDSIVSQNYCNFEILISEDNSPKSFEVEEVVNSYINEYTNIKITFTRNSETMGYDGNFRHLIDISNGQYCVFMGDDDLLCEGALLKIAKVIDEFNPGVILRSWARANRETKTVEEIFRYFDSDRLFKAGKDGIVTMYRRSVAIAGYTVKRDLAKKYSTERFDGTLLYQLYLTGMILSENDGYYISNLVAIMRKDSNQSPTHFFGTAKAERDRFKPGELKESQSLIFIDGMIEIANYLEDELKIPNLNKGIIKDMANYSYPLLSVQSRKPFWSFFRYYILLNKKGFWKNIYFHIYYLALAILGVNYCTKVILWIKNYLNYTPTLGKISRGKKIDKE